MITRVGWPILLSGTALLVGCIGAQKDAVTTPVKAYGQSPSAPLACTLLKASRCAYAIAATGRFNTSDANYASCRDGAIEQRAIAKGEDRINAVLGELTADSVIIAYRGTLPPSSGRDKDAVLQDWIQDAEAEPVREPRVPGAMHRGFYNAFSETQQELLSVLSAWEREGRLRGKPIYVTGHSKGGPVAVIAASHLSGGPFQPQAVYTFAAARAGDQDFLSGYEAKHMTTWRYENRFDLVPHLPPNASDGDLIAKVLTHNRALRHDEYQSIGYLMFINWQGALTADYPGLSAARRAHLEQRMAQPRVAEAIVEAHSSSQGGQYGQAICGERPGAAPPAQ